MVSLSIRTKLFLTLLTAGSLAVAGMHAFMSWSFSNGLVEFAEIRQQERLEQIAERLVERYKADGGWQQIAADKGVWIGILTDYARMPPYPGQGPQTRGMMDALMGRPSADGASGPGRMDSMSGMGGMGWGWGRMMGGPRHGPDGSRGAAPEVGPGGPARFRDHLMRFRDGEPGIWPPTSLVQEARRPGGRPLFFSFRLMLLDAEGKPIQAQPELLPGAPRYPLRLDGERIGELALIPGPYLPESSELQFKESQGQALLLIALAMVLLSALFAFPLAHRLTRPVRAFQDTARRLASGDYAARAASQGDDELGRLGRDLNALAQALEDNEQARRRWVADIAHELRTPLALLQAEIEAAQDGVRPLDARTLAALHADTLRLGRLVEDLHELSMTDLGALSYRKTNLNPLEVLEADLETFQPRFAAAGIGLCLDDRSPQSGGFLPWRGHPADQDARPAPPGEHGNSPDHHVSQHSGPDLRLHGDGQRLSQLFRNLLRNSLQYTDAGGELRIVVSLASEGAGSVAAADPPLPNPPPPGGREQEGMVSGQVIPAPRLTLAGAPGHDWLVIDFQDSAPGVPAEALPHLFERLYRVDASRARHSGGAGLGLAIARNIAAAHGGDIAAHPSPLGGLWIRLRLPLEGNAP